METHTPQPAPDATPPPAGTTEGIEGTKPNGPVAAVMLAAGIGGVVLGLLTTFAVISEGLKDFLELDEGVGPLSGKTTFAVVAFLVSWGGLHAALRNRQVEWRMVIAATIVLFAIALLFTFPTFFEAFESE